MASKETGKNSKPLVLITGAAGDIGTTLTQALKSSYRVIGLDIEPAPEADDSFEFDLTSADSVQLALRKIVDQYGRGLREFTVDRFIYSSTMLVHRQAFALVAASSRGGSGGDAMGLRRGIAGPGRQPAVRCRTCYPEPAAWPDSRAIWRMEPLAGLAGVCCLAMATMRSCRAL